MLSINWDNVNKTMISKSTLSHYLQPIFSSEKQLSEKKPRVEWNYAYTYSLTLCVSYKQGETMEETVSLV